MKSKPNTLPLFLGFPVAIKILSNDFLHKTEIGGVELNINSMESLISSYQKLSKISNNLNIKENEKKFNNTRDGLVVLVACIAFLF